MNLSFLFSLLTGEAADIAARARRTAMEYLLAALGAAAGIFFLLVAAFVYVADNLRYGALKTALIFAAFFIVLALIIVIYHRVRAAVQARRARERRQADMKAAASAAMLAALPAMLPRRGSIGAWVLPAIAAIGLALYHENSRPDRKGDGD